MLAVFLFGFLVVWRIGPLAFGQVLKAIRENEPRAVSLGYDVDRYKLLAFMLSAALAGLAGCDQDDRVPARLADRRDWTMSGEVVLMTLVGGLARCSAPIVGAFVIVAMQNYLAEFGSWVTIIQGAVFVACVPPSGRASSGKPCTCWDAGTNPAAGKTLSEADKPASSFGRTATKTPAPASSRTL